MADHKTEGNCFCITCMEADHVWHLRRNLKLAEQSLEALSKAQRVSSADLLRTVDARYEGGSYDWLCRMCNKPNPVSAKVCQCGVTPASGEAKS